MASVCSASDSIKSIIQECALLLGYSSVKPEQEEAMKAFVKQQRDVFIAVPTGFGKSLRYSLLPLVFDRIREDGKSSIVIVVSPSLALITDQVNAMSKRGLLAFVCMFTLLRWRVVICLASVNDLFKLFN